MPFVTEYNTSLVLKTLIGETPKDIFYWDPYKKAIYFLNAMDKTNLFYFEKFCKNPIENIDTVFFPIEFIDNGEFVFEGAKPSYHKVENCDKLTSHFINFRIPETIKEKGNSSIEEFRKWFKEHQTIFTENPDIYQMRLHTKYGIVQGIEKVDYKNSGYHYKENLTLSEIETRIDSLLHNASKYFNENLMRQEAIKIYQKKTHLAFRTEKIPNNYTTYNDSDLKDMLKEYFYLFIQPTIFYLKEHFKVFYNSNVEINEKIFEYLNFKKCSICYAKDFEQKPQNLLERKKILIERFGDFEFPIEPTKFYFKDIENTEFRQAFIYCLIFSYTNMEFQSDENGNYKIYKAEYINHKNKYIYKDTKIYEDDIPNIQLFRKYITKIEQHKITKQAIFTTYNYQI